MSRWMLALALSAFMVSAALAKDLCIQLDSGTWSGAQVVLKKFKLAAGKTAPVQGYFAFYSSTSASYYEFHPVDGASVVNSAGDRVGLGLTVHSTGVNTAGGFNVGSYEHITLTLACNDGGDGKLGPPDFCSGYFDGGTASSHIVDCKDAPQIP